MDKLIITTDHYDFVIIDLSIQQIIYQQGKTAKLDATELDGQGRPTFRPFGVDTDDEYIYIVSNNRLCKFKKDTYEFIETINVPLYINTHQMLVEGNTIYTCNTGINSIGIYDLDSNTNKQFDVNEKIFIKDILPPSDAVEKDINHVNSLFSTKDDIYYCLHNKGKKFSEYFKFNKKTFDLTLIATAGKESHNILIIGDILYSLSTATGELLIINMATQTYRCIKIVDHNTVFLRGLSVYNNQLIIGCSVNFKNVSATKSSFILFFDLATNQTSQIMGFENINFINDLKIM